MESGVWLEEASYWGFVFEGYILKARCGSPYLIPVLRRLRQKDCKTTVGYVVRLLSLTFSHDCACLL
jgi:hypothetical protein